MLFIVIFCLLSLYCLIQSFRGDSYSEGYWMGGFIWIMIFNILLSFIIIGSGVTIYPELKSNRQEIISLYNEMETIEQAYHINIQEGTLVGGSLDNLGQAQKWTEYVRLYAEKKAEYNKDLEYYTTIKPIKIYQLWSYSLFISNKINDLEKLK